MNKYFYIIFGIIIFQSNVLAKSFKIKGEPDIGSPLALIQERDSLLMKRYAEAMTLFKKDDFSNALTLSLKLHEDLKSNSLKFQVNFLIGDIFRKLRNHQKSLIYFKRSLKYLGDTVDSELSLSSNLNNNKHKAITYLKLGVLYKRIEKNDSAIYFFKKIIDEKSVNNEIHSELASAYNNLSTIYIRDSLYGLAKNYSLKAVKIRQEMNDKVSEASTLGNLASIHLLEGDYNKAKEIYNKALGLLENENSSVSIQYKEDLYYNLAWALYNLKDYKAYHYQELSYLIKDSLKDKQIQHLVKGVFEKHQVELQKEKVNLVKTQVELKKAEEKKTVLFFSILSFFLIISSGVIIYNYKLRQRNLKLKIVQSEFAKQSAIEKLRSESQVRILNATIDGKETERKQIAETLHDSVSSLLSSANLHLQASKMQFNGDAPTEIIKTQKIINEASQTIRNLSHTLVSSVLLKFGLKYAINDMAEKYSNSQIQISTDIQDVKRYSQSFEIKAHNIIQELVNNILKHSEASQALVKLVEEKGKLKIAIKDNGKGFDKTKITNKDGLGINQIEARIQVMSGFFSIDSSLKKGTNIEIILPIQEKEQLVTS